MSENAHEEGGRRISDSGRPAATRKLGSFSLGFGDLSTDDIDAEMLSKFLTEVDATMPETIQDIDADAAIFRTRLETTHGTGMNLMTALLSGASELLNWARNAVDQAAEADDDQEQVEKLLTWHECLWGLAGRALQVYAEVTWLLRGGFPNGAMARVRTMHELFVTAYVIGAFGQPGGDHPELVERYLRHQETFVRKEANDLIAYGGGVFKDLFDQATLDALDQKKKMLEDRFGKGFSTSWGWAQPLFPDGGGIGIQRLAKLAMPDWNYFYTLTSSQNHAGSKAWHDTFVEYEDQVFIFVGPTENGLFMPAYLASRLLLVTLMTVVPTEVSGEDGEADHLGKMGLATLRNMVGRIDSAFQVAQEEVDRSEDGPEHSGGQREDHLIDD